MTYCNKKAQGTKPCATENNNDTIYPKHKLPFEIACYAWGKYLFCGIVLVLLRIGV